MCRIRMTNWPKRATRGGSDTRESGEDIIIGSPQRPNLKKGQEENEGRKEEGPIAKQKDDDNGLDMKDTIDQVSTKASEVRPSPTKRHKNNDMRRWKRLAREGLKDKEIIAVEMEEGHPQIIGAKRAEREVEEWDREVKRKASNKEGEAQHTTAMNCLVWNARGLGSPGAFHKLRRLVAEATPGVVFQSETKLVEEDVDGGGWHWEWKGCFV